MTGDEFIRKLRQWARKNSRSVEVYPHRGKGSHGQVRVTPGGLTTVKKGEISRPLKAKMMRDLDVPVDAF